jgi:hypothetical protein
MLILEPFLSVHLLPSYPVADMKKLAGIELMDPFCDQAEAAHTLSSSSDHPQIAAFCKASGRENA